MNEEDVTKLLDDVVPAAPSVKGWAGRASGRVRRRRVVTGALAAVVTLGVPIGLTISQQGTGPLEATPLPAESTASGPENRTAEPEPADSTELLARGAIVQRPGEDPLLCIDGVSHSWIPGCAAPLPLVGLDWDDIDHSDRDGTLVAGSALLRGFLAEDASSLTITGVESPHSMPTVLPPARKVTVEQQDAAVERIQQVLPESRLAVENWVSPGYAEEFDFVSVRLAEYDPEVLRGIEEAAGPEVSVRVTTILTPVGRDLTTLFNFEGWEDQRTQELAGTVAIYQGPSDPEPRLYLCGTPPFAAKSRAPDLTGARCDGPSLKGDFDWNDAAEHSSSPNDEGVRWTVTEHRVQGYLDLDDGGHGSFTLSRPVVHVGPTASQPPLGGEPVATGPPIPATAEDARGAIQSLTAALDPTGKLVRAVAEQQADGDWLVDVLVLVVDEEVSAALQGAEVTGVRVRTQAVLSPIE